MSRLRWPMLGLLMLIATHPITFADETSVNAQPLPVDNALDGSIWFDDEQRKLVPVPLRPEVDDSLNRTSRWLPKADRIRKSNAPVGNPTGLFGTGWTIANLVAWAVLISLGVLILGVLGYAISGADKPASITGRHRSLSGNELPDEQMAERMRHLPVELRRSDVNLRNEAERLMNAGEYDRAIILLYGHQLLLLDHVGILRLNRGKTNRRYLRESRAASHLVADILQQTVAAFERSYFGRHSIDVDQFDALWQANAELETLARKQPEVAA